MASAASAKSEALELIARLPENVTLDQIAEALDFVAAVNEGLADAENGLTLSHAQVMREHLEWRKSAGR